MSWKALGCPLATNEWFHCAGCDCRLYKTSSPHRLSCWQDSHDSLEESVRAVRCRCISVRECLSYLIGVMLRIACLCRTSSVFFFLNLEVLSRLFLSIESFPPALPRLTSLSLSFFLSCCLVCPQVGILPGQGWRCFVRGQLRKTHPNGGRR